MPEQLIQWILVHGIQSQVAGLGVSLQQSLAFQKAADTASESARQLCEFLAGRRFDSAEPDGPVGTVKVQAIRKQHVKVDVEV